MGSCIKTSALSLSVEKATSSLNAWRMLKNIASIEVTLTSLFYGMATWLGATGTQALAACDGEMFPVCLCKS
jgi:hypothetical protein